MQRAPYVLPHLISSGDRSHQEIAEELAAAGATVGTDELGMMVLFASEEDSEALLTDPRFGAVAMSALHVAGITDGPLFELWSQLMFGKDGDDHRRIRGAVAEHFTPSALAFMEPVAAEMAAALAAALPDDAPVDLWPAYALPLAARTQCRLVGIPEDDAMRVAAWALALVKGFGILTPEDRVEAERAAVEFLAYLDALIAQKRETPGEDILSSLLRDKTDVLSYEELRALAANLIFGGLEAVTKGILKSVIHLVEHGLWSAVTDRDVAAHAVMELLRFDPLTTGVARLATDEVDVGGTVLQPGQLALVNLWGVCHDARRYDAADELRIDRQRIRPHAFGAGAHFCLGFVLAKITIAAALHALATCAPNLTLAATRDELPWSADPFDGPTALPVRVG